MNDRQDQAQDNLAELPAYVRSFKEEVERSRMNKDEEGLSPIWLLTFTDVMALMLTFFVLLYSMARPNEKQWDDITGALNKQFSEYYAPQFNQGAVDVINIDKISLRSALNLDYLMGLIKEGLQGTSAYDDIVFLPQRDTLIISMPQDMLFESGRAEVSTEGKKMLFTLGGVLSHIRNNIEVVGHADPRPISVQNQNFKSNWDLSLMRAVGVADILKDVGYDRDVTVRGSAAGRFADLPEEMDLELRQDLARRVDIVILKNDGSVRRAFDSFQ